MKLNQIDNSLIIELKKQLIEIAHLCSRRNMQTGNGGNISVRIPNHNFMIIKASGDSFENSDENSFVISDFSGNLIMGNRSPSRECLLHSAIYKKLLNVNAIVHCHSPWATGWASTLKDLPFSTYHSEMKLQGKIHVFDTHSYAVSQEYIKNIMNLFDNNPDTKAFLLKGHGQVALGKSLYNAVYNAELVEETAHIAVIERLLAK